MSFNPFALAGLILFSWTIIAQDMDDPRFQSDRLTVQQRNKLKKEDSGENPWFGSFANVGLFYQRGQWEDINLRTAGVGGELDGGLQNSLEILYRNLFVFCFPKGKKAQLQRTLGIATEQIGSH